MLNYIPSGSPDSAAFPDPSIAAGDAVLLLGSAAVYTVWAFNVLYVGMYMIPDIDLLMFLAIVPDLIQGLYMTVVVIVDRLDTKPGTVKD